MVVGFDLRNEIRDDLINNRKPNWGKGDMDDWWVESISAACLLQDGNPDLLIFIEGLNSATNLDPMKNNEKEDLCTPNKLVYSFHFFESTSFEFDSYDDFKQKMD